MDNKTKEDLAREKRLIWFEGEVNRDMKDFAKQAIFYHFSKDGGKSPLLFLIDSGGGSLDWGLGIHDLIVAYPGKTIGLVFPWAASAAAMILQGAKVRWSTPGSRLLFHNPLISNMKFDMLLDDDSWKKVRRDLEQTKQRAHDAHSRLKPGGASLDTLFKEDREMYPQEAASIGAIDEIVNDPIVRFLKMK